MSKPTILLADDNEDDIFLMRRIFRHMGLEDRLRVVRDGAEAIDYLTGKREFANRETYPYPSLLILDMNMPKRTGQEVLDWLKQRPELKRLFVVVLAGASRSVRSEKMLERHGNVAILNSEFLKPARLDSVQNLVGLFESWLRTAEASNRSPSA